MALLLAAAFGTVAPPPAIDFGAVQLGRAGVRTIALRADEVDVHGAGYSATRTRGGVLVVFEPYEREVVRGSLLVRAHGHSTRVALRGRGIDTLVPRLVVTRAALRGGTLTVGYLASDNDLVSSCVLAVGNRVVGRARWPATSVRARVPRGARALRITLTAIDRAGNRASTPVRVSR